VNVLGLVGKGAKEGLRKPGDVMVTTNLELLQPRHDENAFRLPTHRFASRVVCEWKFRNEEVELGCEVSGDALFLTVKDFLSRIWKLLCGIIHTRSMENKVYRLGYHLVIFIDVQGQRDKFKGLRLPKTAEEHASVQQALRDTAGFVIGLREAFRKNFAAFEEGISGKETDALRP
jgi:hypothetical protein